MAQHRQAAAVEAVVDEKAAVAAAMHPTTLVWAANALLPHVASTASGDPTTSKAAASCGPARALPVSLAALREGWLRRTALKRWRSAGCSSTAFDQPPETFFVVTDTLVYSLRAAWLALRLHERASIVAQPQSERLLQRIGALQQALSAADSQRLHDVAPAANDSLAPTVPGSCVQRVVGAADWGDDPSIEEMERMMRGARRGEALKLSGEEACEGKGLAEAECLAVGCCSFDAAQTHEPCFSRVGNAPCTREPAEDSLPSSERRGQPADR